jgi:hypothetical protein
MKKLQSLTNSCLILGCIVTLMPLTVHAQGVFENNSSDNRNPFGRASAGDTSGLMQLINEAQIRGKSKTITAEEQQKRIDEDTADFLSYRRKLLLQQRKNTNKNASSTQP